MALRIGMCNRVEVVGVCRLQVAAVERWSRGLAGDGEGCEWKGPGRRGSTADARMTNGALTFYVLSAFRWQMGAVRAYQSSSEAREQPDC